jgi:hypothetical protein
MGTPRAELHPLIGKPVFFALSAADGRWTRALSKTAALRFDYILADGRSGRNEAVPIADRQSFIDNLLAQTVNRLDTEPIDIYTHPTELPESMKADDCGAGAALRIRIAGRRNLQAGLAQFSCTCFLVAVGRLDSLILGRVHESLRPPAPCG